LIFILKFSGKSHFIYITMPRSTDNVTCHTQRLDTWHFIYLFIFKLKKIKIKKN